MKKETVWKTILRILFFGFLIFYLYVSLKYRQNTWQFILIARFGVPLFFTGAIILSHYLFPPSRNILSLLRGGFLMLPGGLLLLFLGRYAVGWHLLLALILVFTFLVLSDMGGRWLCSKFFGRKFSSNRLINPLPVEEYTYYFFLFLIYFVEIALLNFIF